MREGHVVYLEPIEIGSRIRDLIEGHDGRIILWTDDDTLISLRPKDERSSGESTVCGEVQRVPSIGADQRQPDRPESSRRRRSADRRTGELSGFFAKSTRPTRYLGRKTTGFIPQGAASDRFGNCNGLRWRCKRRGTRGHYSVSQHATVLGYCHQARSSPTRCSSRWCRRQSGTVNSSLTLRPLPEAGQSEGDGHRPASGRIPGTAVAR